MCKNNPHKLIKLHYTIRKYPFKIKNISIVNVLNIKMKNSIPTKIL